MWQFLISSSRLYPYNLTTYVHLSVCPHDALCDLPRTPGVQIIHVSSLSSLFGQLFLAAGYNFVVSSFVPFCVRYSHLFSWWWHRNRFNENTIQKNVFFYSFWMYLNTEYSVVSRRSLEQLILLAIRHFLRATEALADNWGRSTNILSHTLSVSFLVRCDRSQDHSVVGRWTVGFRLRISLAQCVVEAIMTYIVESCLFTYRLQGRFVILVWLQMAVHEVAQPWWGTFLSLNDSTRCWHRSAEHECVPIFRC